MPSVKVAQKARVGGSPVAAFVTKSGRAISLSYTPQQVQITPTGPDYKQVERQGRAPLVRMAGTRPAQLRFTHMVADPRGRSIDHKIKLLANLVDAGEQVRILNASRMETAGWWIIDAAEISVERRNPKQHAMQARITWTLLPYTPPPAKIATPPKPPAPKKKTPARRSHTVVWGDTLWAISKRYLGNPTRYPEIAKLNKIKNPNLIYPGEVFTMPAK